MAKTAGWSGLRLNCAIHQLMWGAPKRSEYLVSGLPSEPPEMLSLGGLWSALLLSSKML